MKKELILLLEDTLKDMQDLIDRDKEEIDRENKVRNKLSDSPTMGDYLKDLEKLQGKLKKVVQKIETEINEQKNTGNPSRLSP